FHDRHDREMIYGPTNELMITDIFRSAVHSYRDLPRTLYHIQWKFRDEVRPRFGVLRGREFLMKDGYSFDLDFASAKKSYDAMYASYLRTFRRMGLRAIAARAESGAIGGELSHEFLVLADTGESRVFYDAALDTLDVESTSPAQMQALYAATDDMHGKLPCDVPADRLVKSGALEVGHIFYFGDHYSKLLGANVMGPDGESIPILSGSYGIGVSRMVGAIIEASHDEAGIVWPEAVAPFQVGLINLKTGDEACDGQAEDLLSKLTAQGVETLYDDRDERPGAKFAGMDLIGLPWQLVVGPRGLARGVVEMKNRRTGERQELSPESAMARLSG
ncbi:MAG: proline--tRNA ligase, partial [Alphaproteobacteria bacterium]